MQPEQQNPQPETWREPARTAPQAPYQAPVDTPADPESFAEPDMPVVQPETDATTDDMPAETPQTDTSSVDDGALVRWQASEYLHQDQSPLWFVVMGIVVAVLMAVGFFWMRSVTFMILIPVMAVALVVYVKRPPAINDYTLSRKGLHVNDKLYPFDTFKSFGVVSRADNHSVVLVPRKRFQLGHTIYFPEELGEQIVDMFAARLPMKEVSTDFIDKLLSKLHL